MKVITSTIKRATGAGSIDPNNLTAPCRVLPPALVGMCRPNATIAARDEARGSGTQFAKLVTQGHTVGLLLTYFETKGECPSSWPTQVQATSVGSALLMFPERREMARVDAIVAHHRQSTQARGRLWNDAGQLPFNGHDNDAPIPEGAVASAIYAQINVHINAQRISGG